MGTNTKSRALIYTRVSDDRTGKARSTAEQNAECRDRCKRERWRVVDELSDVSISASRYARRTRPAWAQVLDRIASGTVDVLVLWESSRATRKLSGFAELRDLLREHKVLLSTSDGLLDMNRSGDRTTAGIKAVLAEEASETTQENVTRAMRYAAMAGRPHGKLQYGYRREYDPKTRELLAVEIDEPQADVLREMARRFLAGESMRSITLDLNERKVPSPRGDWWHPSNPPRLLKNPAYHGKRVHQGKVVGDAIWPAIFDDATWYELQTKLGDPSRNTRGNGVARYLLGGTLLTCGPCQRDKVQRRVGVQVRRPRNYLSYQCCEAGRFCVARSVHQLDDYISDVIIARYSRPDVADIVATDDKEATLAAQQASGEAAVLRARLAEFVQQGIAGQLSPATLATIEQSLTSQIEAAEARARELRIPGVVRDLVSADNVGARWDSYDLSRKREIVRATMTITLNRTQRGARTLDPGSIAIRWLV